MANEVDYSPSVYIGNGITKDFSFDWKILDKTDIIVSLMIDGEYEVLNLGSDYQVEIEATGGVVTLNVAPETEQRIKIERYVSIYQKKKYSTSSGFQGDEIEKSFDRVSCNIQDMGHNIEAFKSTFVDEVGEKIETINETFSDLAEIDITELVRETQDLRTDMADFLEQFGDIDSRVAETARKALDDIQKSSELALSSHFMGEFVKTSLPFVDEHLTEANGQNLDNTNEYFANFYASLKALKDLSDRAIAYHHIYGRGTHHNFWTKTAPVVNGDEILIRLDKDKTYMKPIDKIGDEETRLTIVPTFNLYSYRRFGLISGSGNVPEYITPILTGEDDNSALWNPLGFNTTPIEADKFYSTDFDNVTLTTTEQVVTGAVISNVDGVEQYKITYADGAIGYYDMTPVEPLQVVTDIELPYYYYADAKAGYEYIGADVFNHNDNFLTDWEYYNVLKDNSDYKKYYLPENNSAEFYNGYEPKYTNNDTVTITQTAKDVPVETMDKEKVYITTKNGYQTVVNNLGLTIDGNIGSIVTSKEARFCLDNVANTPNNAVYREHPTIEDGVASGFNTTTYIVAPVSNGNRIEYVVKFHTPSPLVARQGVLCHREKAVHLEVYNNQLRYYNYTPAGYTNLLQVTADTDYWVKCIVDFENKVKIYSYSTDGENWSEPVEKADTGMDINGANIIGFGNTSVATQTGSYYYGGSIDLRETYIKEGEQVVWQGTQYNNNETISLGDVYFEFVTPNTFVNSTEILHLNRSLGFYIQNKSVTNPNGTVNIVPELNIKGGRTSKSWAMYQSTNIALEPNTRYALTFSTVPDTVNKRPLRWEVELVNLYDGSIQTFSKDTTYYPYNYANAWGFTGIYSQWDYLAHSGCIVDLDSIVIKGQHYTIRGLKKYNDVATVTMNKNTIYLPKISEDNGEKTYVVLNGVQAVNTAYAIDLSPYALKAETYSKEEIDNMDFATMLDLPNFDEFVSAETFNIFAGNVVENFATKNELPQKLGDLENDLEFATMDAVEERFTELFEQAQIGNLD